MSETNLKWWNEFGGHLIPAMPFLDSVIVKSEGSYLTDAEGNRILDFASGQFCTILGHNHPRFVEALTAELKRNLHTGSQYVTDTVMKAAKDVAAICPEDLSSVIFLSTGTEANELALRIAKACTKRTGIIGFDRGYYGISLATRSLSAISEGKIDFSPIVPGSAHVITPTCTRCPLQLEPSTCELACLSLSNRLLGNAAEDCAAIIVETIVSAGGMIYPSPEYLAALEMFARSIGALFIVDEAQTGFGRCGRWFDCENLGITPDILVFSKTSGNGFPSAGVVISDKLKDKLFDRGFNHLSSHQNDSVAAAAVSAVIRVIVEEELLGRCRDHGAYFLERLRELEREHDHLVAPRGRGLMIAFELTRDRDGQEPYTEMLTPFVLACKARGLHLTYTYFEGAIRLLPPLTVSRDEIDFSIEIMSQVLNDLSRGPLEIDGFRQENEVNRRMSRGRTLRKVADRIWETTPRHWLDKLSGRR